jgi:hypothetical protein
MFIIDWVKSKIFKRPIPGSVEQPIAPISSYTLREIMVRAKNDVQKQKLIAAAEQLENVFTSNENRFMVAMMFMVDEAYPFLEKIPEHEPMTVEWHEVFGGVMDALNRKAEGKISVQEEEKINRIIDQIQKAN